MHDRIKGERRRKIEAAQAAAIDLVGAFARYANAHPETPVLVGVHEFSARNGEPAAREVIPLGRAESAHRRRRDPGHEDRRRHADW